MSKYHHDAWIGRNKSVHTQSGEVETGNTGKIHLHLQLTSDMYKMSDRNNSNCLPVSFDCTKSFPVDFNGKLNRIV